MAGSWASPPTRPTYSSGGTPSTMSDPLLYHALCCAEHRRRRNHASEFSSLLSQASKAAALSFYDTLRMELGSDIRITEVVPGVVESEITKGKMLTKGGEMKVDQDERDVRTSVGRMHARTHLIYLLICSACFVLQAILGPTPAEPVGDFARTDGARRVPGREVRVRAQVVHGRLPAAGLPPGGPGLELPPAHCRHGRRVHHGHARKVAGRAARRAPRRAAAVAPLAGDQGLVTVIVYVLWPWIALAV
jgi:hypothetical protein